jgi:hypothetical protein
MTAIGGNLVRIAPQTLSGVIRRLWITRRTGTSRRTVRLPRLQSRPRPPPPQRAFEDASMKSTLIATLVTLGLAGLPALAQETTGSVNPDATTVDIAQRAVENRAFEAAIWGMPVVNYDLMRQEMLTKTAAKENEVVYWGKPLDWHNQTLTPNPDTIYLMTFYNTKDVGPVVIEVPPAGDAGSMNVNVVNIWQMPLEDAGLMGVDKGAGVKFLILPPGYEGDVPEGYAALNPETHGGFVLFRSNLKSHSDEDVAKSVAYGKQIKVYPLSQAEAPPETAFIDASDVVFDSTIRYDVSFFENLDRIIQNEPWLDRDRAMIDSLRSLGIEKGKSFAPDESTRVALAGGIESAREYLEAEYDAGFPPFWEGPRWMVPANPELIAAIASDFNDPDAYPVEARGLTYTYAFVGIKRLGAGQFYLISIKDKDGSNLDGGKTYKLTVPPNAPVEQYWSVTLYDRETHALIRNVDRASRASNSGDLMVNADGSIDLYFGPTPPEGMEANWVPTDPAREFEAMLRLYGPKQEFFDNKTAWVLPDIEKAS